ncbi:MAG TPA: DUF805 domain-containing protein [Pyrinomonadaceae bacterium]|jgi:uncharacterized membrane protein YhaH (DUF805 family)
MNWYLEVLKKYAVFSGRARRKEYWFFTLFNIIISLALTMLDIWLGLADRSGWGPLGGIYTLAVFIPGLAVTVRRLHDTGRSGWWFLIALVPCVGGIILLIYLVEDSQPGENEYGPNPKMETQWQSPPPPPDFSGMPR